VDASGPLEDVIAGARRLLVALRAAALAPFLAEWPPPAARSGGGARQAPGSTLPVLRWLSRIGSDTCCVDPALVAALCAAAPLMGWRQTYTREQIGADFLDNYAWSELFGPSSRAGGRLSCGVLLLGPNTFYPRHRHEAEEIYVPLSGTANWQQGDDRWRQRSPGTLIHHLTEEPHAMQTREEPLLAIYLWRSANLSQEARLDRRRAG